MKKTIITSIIIAALFMAYAPSASAQITLQTSNPNLKVKLLNLSGYIPNTQAAPIITLGTTTPRESSTLITWNTDKLSKSKLYYDTKPIMTEEALGPEHAPTVSSGFFLNLQTMSTSTTAELFHLSSGTTYYYLVQSIDRLGNVTITSQNTFTTR